MNDIATIPYYLMVSCMLAAPILLVGRLFMHFSNRGSAKVRKLMTVLTLVMCIFGALPVMWFSLAWPYLRSH
jgi:hypothetical protein